MISQSTLKYKVPVTRKPGDRHLSVLVKIMDVFMYDFFHLSFYVSFTGGKKSAFFILE